VRSRSIERSSTTINGIRWVYRFKQRTHVCAMCLMFRNYYFYRRKDKQKVRFYSTYSLLTVEMKCFREQRLARAFVSKLMLCCCKNICCIGLLYVTCQTGFLCGSASCSRLRLSFTGPCPATPRVTWPTTVSSSPTPVSDNRVLPTL